MILSKQQVLIVGLAVVLATITGMTVSSVSQRRDPEPDSKLTQSTSAPSPSPAIPLGSHPPTVPLATIQGALIYPAEAIPSDLRVCALNLVSQRESCTDQHLARPMAASRQGYRLMVPSGSYQVYAIAPSFDSGYRAYYSRFVTCGLRADCTDHSPIIITVATGQLLDGVDVGDFYRTD